MPPRLKLTPETLVTRAWADYALLDSGGGRKLERYGRHTVVRPEPQCFWSPRDPDAAPFAPAQTPHKAQPVSAKYTHTDI